MAAEKVKLEVPVVLKIDKKSVSDTRNAFRKLTNDLSKASVDWKKLGRTQQVNAKELIRIGTEAAALGGKISKAAQDSGKKMGQLGKATIEAQKQAEAVGKKMRAAKDPKVKAGLSAEANKLKGILNSLGNQVQKQGKIYKTHSKAYVDAAKAQKKNAKIITDAGKASVASTLGGVGKGVMGGIQQGGIKGAGQAIGAVGKGVGSLAAKGVVKAGASEATMAKMGAAVGMMGGAIMAIGAFLKLLSMASDHMTGLNKALLKGSGLANDMGLSGANYRKSVDEIRTATIGAAGSLLKFGVNSEKALTDINAFGMAATGSIRKTQVMLQQIGGGTLEQGVRKFATAATVYGKSLGMESTEVAKMMGDFVSDIGISHENVIGVMDSIVQTAAVANMPIHKMMDVFHDVLPDVNLFTNRIEELTGTMKLLSKSMDAKSMKSFMKTMSKGFDELDFKQRLKMAFVIGPDKVAKILDKDFKASGKAIAKEFGELGPDVEKALDAADPVKAMADVASRAEGAGKNAAAIQKAQELARNKAASKKGGVLGTATAMRGAGAYARMNMLEEYAGKMTGGDISGLGEHVAKQLGVSEAEYKAILALKDNEAKYQASLKSTGKTSSKSMNANLMKIWKTGKMSLKEDAKLSAEQEEQFTKDMQDISTKPSEMKDMLQQAAAMQATETDAVKESAEDLAAEQYNVTASIGDKLESVVGYFLEKIFSVLQPVLSIIEDLFDAVTGNADAKAAAARHKQTIAAQVDAANLNEKRQKEMLKGFGGTKEMQAQLAGMTSVLKEGATQTDPNQFAEAVKPVLDQVGKMSVKSFDAQTNKLKASGEKSILRADTRAADELRAKLMEIEKVKKMGAGPAIVSKLEHEAEQIVEGSVKAMVQQGQGVTAQNVLGSIAGGIALSGGGMGVGDPNAVATAKKQKEAMRKSADLIGDAGDHFNNYANAAAPGGGTVSPPNPVSTQGKAAVGVPSGVAAGPSGVAGLPGAGATKTPEPPPGHDDQIKIMETAGKSQEEIAKVAEADYQNTSDTLSLLKKGIKFEQSWMNTKFKNVLKESTLDSFRTALLEQTIIYAKMWEDTDFRKAFAEGGKEILSKTNLESVIKEVGGGKDSADQIAKLTKPHATGLMGVPYDNYLASLHKGEMVLPASNARMGGKGGGKSVNVVVYATGVPASEVARRIGAIANTD